MIHSFLVKGGFKPQPTTRNTTQVAAPSPTPRKRRKVAHSRPSAAPLAQKEGPLIIPGVRYHRHTTHVAYARLTSICDDRLSMVLKMLPRTCTGPILARNKPSSSTSVRGTRTHCTSTRMRTILSKRARLTRVVHWGYKLPAARCRPQKIRWEHIHLRRRAILRRGSGRR